MFSITSRILSLQIVLVHIVRIIWLLVNYFWCMQRFKCFATLFRRIFHFIIASFSFRARKFVCCYIRLIIIFDSTAKKQPETLEETIECIYANCPMFNSKIYFFLLVSFDYFDVCTLKPQTNCTANIRTSGTNTRNNSIVSHSEVL